MYDKYVVDRSKNKNDDIDYKVAEEVEAHPMMKFSVQ